MLCLIQPYCNVSCTLKYLDMRQDAHMRLALGVSPQKCICYVMYSYTSVVCDILKTVREIINAYIHLTINNVKFLNVRTTTSRSLILLITNL